MIRNIFLDRDGTINEIILREANVTSPRTIEEFKLRDDFVSFHNRAVEAGHNLFIISNQPEVARGLIDSGFLEQINDIISKTCKIREISYCLHDNEDECDCRKPKPGMINEIIKKHSLLRDESIMIGDTWKDIAAGKAAGVKTVMLRRHYNRDGKCQPDHEVGTLMELWDSGVI